jgi:hypothetical protein
VSLRGWPEWLGEKALYAAIVIGLAAGLLGAIGRERHEGRRPSGDWLTNRLLIMPLFAVVSATLGVTVLATLPRAVAMFVATMLSLAGFRALDLLEKKTLSRIANALPIGADAVPEAAPGLDVAHRPVTEGTSPPLTPGRPDVQPIRKLRDAVPLEATPLDQAVLLDRLKDVPGKGEPEQR